MNDTPITITKKEEKECDVRSICVGADKVQCSREEFDTQNREILVKEKITPNPILYTLEVDKSLKGVWDWEKIYPMKNIARGFEIWVYQGALGSDDTYIKRSDKILNTIYDEKGSSAWNNILKELVYHPTDKKGKLTDFCLHFAAFVGEYNSGGEGCRVNSLFAICSKLPLCSELWDEIEEQIINRSQGEKNTMSLEQRIVVSDYMLKNCPKMDVEKLVEEIVTQKDKLKTSKCGSNTWKQKMEKKIDSLLAEFEEARQRYAKNFFTSSDSENKPIK